MPLIMIEVVSFRMMVGPGCAHSVTVVDAVTMTEATVVVTGAFVTVLFTVTMDSTTTVEVALTVVVERVMERQEHADEISEGGKVVR